jgi:serine/threonine protein kinase
MNPCWSWSAWSTVRYATIFLLLGKIFLLQAYEPLLVMERMEHGSLRDLALNHTIPFDGDVIVPMVRHIAQGLSFLHSCQPPMVHGDLKGKKHRKDTFLVVKIFALLSFLHSCPPPMVHGDLKGALLLKSRLW